MRFDLDQIRGGAFLVTASDDAALVAAHEWEDSPEMYLMDGDVACIAAALRCARAVPELVALLDTRTKALVRLTTTQGFVGAVDGYVDHILWAELTARAAFARAALDNPSLSVPEKEEVKWEPDDSF